MILKRVTSQDALAELAVARLRRQAFQYVRSFASKSRGGSLIESVVAVMVFTAVGVAVLGGLSTTQISGAHTTRQSDAENIARNQMEYVFTLPYQDPPGTYPFIATPTGYTVTAVAEEDPAGNPNVSKIVVTVTFEGQEVLVVETLRSKS